MQICHFNTLFGAHHAENVILFIFKLLKFIVYIVKLLQNLNLIKFVLNPKDEQGETYTFFNSCQNFNIIISN
jgi:hypothetical protein